MHQRIVWSFPRTPDLLILAEERPKHVADKLHTGRSYSLIKCISRFHYESIILPHSTQFSDTTIRFRNTFLSSLREVFSMK
jgi:hypothetical protein